jgi:hypothetical protein
VALAVVLAATAAAVAATVTPVVLLAPLPGGKSVVV